MTLDDRAQAILEGKAVPAPRTDRTAAAGISETPYSDLGNARRLVDIHGADLAYAAGAWRVWDGRRWKADGTLEAQSRAQNVADSMLRDAVELPLDRSDKKKAIDFALKSQSDRGLTGMLNQARPILSAAPDEFDTAPYLFNSMSGTIDLEAEEVREHRRSDRLTKIADAHFDPDARSELWNLFLESVLPDAEVRDFLRRCVGYALSGLAPEEIVMLLGGGANGKSTFLEAVRGALGDYAVSLESSLLLRQRNRGGDELYHLARLDGARLAVATETGEGRGLAEAAVKKLTGGETISARLPYGVPFDFRPVAKLMISTNHAPRVAGSDEGIWRRVVLVPFDVTIAEAQRDRDLPAKLAMPEARAAILAWAWAGWLDYRERRRLDPPDQVRARVREHREAEDILGRFVSDVFEVTGDSADFLSNAQVKGAIDGWVQSEAMEERESRWLTVRRVGARLRAAGLPRCELRWPEDFTG